MLLPCGTRTTALEPILPSSSSGGGTRSRAPTSPSASPRRPGGSGSSGRRSSRPRSRTTSSASPPAAASPAPARPLGRHLAEHAASDPNGGAELVYWLRKLVFRSAWLDQRVKLGLVEVRVRRAHGRLPLRRRAPAAARPGRRRALLGRHAVPALSVAGAGPPRSAARGTMLRPMAARDGDAKTTFQTATERAETRIVDLRAREAADLGAVRAALARAEGDLDTVRAATAELRAVLPTRVEAAVDRALLGAEGGALGRRLDDLQALTRVDRDHGADHRRRRARRAARPGRGPRDRSSTCWRAASRARAPTCSAWSGGPSASSRASTASTARCGASRPRSCAWRSAVEADARPAFGRTPSA